MEDVEVVTTEESQGWTGAVFDAVIGGGGDASPAVAQRAANKRRNLERLRTLCIVLEDEAELYLRAPLVIIDQWRCEIGARAKACRAQLQLQLIASSSAGAATAVSTGEDGVYAHIVALEIPFVTRERLPGSAAAAAAEAGESSSISMYAIALTQQRVAAATAEDAPAPPFTPCSAPSPLPPGADWRSPPRAMPTTRTVLRSYRDFARLRERLLEFCVRGGHPVERSIARFLDGMVDKQVSLFYYYLLFPLDPPH